MSMGKYIGIGIAGFVAYEWLKGQGYFGSTALPLSTQVNPMGSTTVSNPAAGTSTQGSTQVSSTDPTIRNSTSPNNPVGTSYLNTSSSVPPGMVSAAIRDNILAAALAGQPSGWDKQLTADQWGYYYNKLTGHWAPWPFGTNFNRATKLSLDGWLSAITSTGGSLTGLGTNSILTGYEKFLLR